MNGMPRTHADWWRRYHRWGRIRFVAVYGAMFIGGLALALSMALLFAINASYFFVIVDTRPIVPVIWCAFLGACVGFLWYEFNEARYKRSFSDSE